MISKPSSLGERCKAVIRTAVTFPCDMTSTTGKELPNSINQSHDSIINSTHRGCTTIKQRRRTKRPVSRTAALLAAICLFNQADSVHGWNKQTVTTSAPTKTAFRPKLSTSLHHMRGGSSPSPSSSSSGSSKKSSKRKSTTTISDEELDRYIDFLLAVEDSDDEVLSERDHPLLPKTPQAVEEDLTDDSEWMMADNLSDLESSSSAADDISPTSPQLQVNEDDEEAVTAGSSAAIQLDLAVEEEELEEVVKEASSQLEPAMAVIETTAAANTIHQDLVEEHDSDMGVDDQGLSTMDPVEQVIESVTATTLAESPLVNNTIVKEEAFESEAYAVPAAEVEDEDEYEAQQMESSIEEAADVESEVDILPDEVVALDAAIDDMVASVDDDDEVSLDIDISMDETVPAQSDKALQEDFEDSLSISEEVEEESAMEIEADFVDDDGSTLSSEPAAAAETVAAFVSSAVDATSDSVIDLDTTDDVAVIVANANLGGSKAHSPLLEEDFEEETEETMSLADELDYAVAASAEIPEDMDESVSSDDFHLGPSAVEEISQPLVNVAAVATVAANTTIDQGLASAVEPIAMQEYIPESEPNVVKHSLWGVEYYTTEYPTKEESPQPKTDAYVVDEMFKADERLCLATNAAIEASKPLLLVETLPAIEEDPADEEALEDVVENEEPQLVPISEDGRSKVFSLQTQLEIATLSAMYAAQRLLEERSVNSPITDEDADFETPSDDNSVVDPDPKILHVDLEDISSVYSPNARRAKADIVAKMASENMLKQLSQVIKEEQSEDLDQTPTPEQVENSEPQIIFYDAIDKEELLHSESDPDSANFIAMKASIDLLKSRGFSIEVGSQCKIPESTTTEDDSVETIFDPILGIEYQTRVSPKPSLSASPAPFRLLVSIWGHERGRAGAVNIASVEQIDEIAQSDVAHDQEMECSHAQMEEEVGDVQLTSKETEEYISDPVYFDASPTTIEETEFVSVEAVEGATAEDCTPGETETEGSEGGVSLDSFHDASQDNDEEATADAEMQTLEEESFDAEATTGVESQIENEEADDKTFHDALAENAQQIPSTAPEPQELFEDVEEYEEEATEDFEDAVEEQEETEYDEEKDAHEASEAFEDAIEEQDATEDEDELNNTFQMATAAAVVQEEDDVEYDYDLVEESEAYSENEVMQDSFQTAVEIPAIDEEVDEVAQYESEDQEGDYYDAAEDIGIEDDTDNRVGHQVASQPAKQSLNAELRETAPPNILFRIMLARNQEQWVMTILLFTEWTKLYLEPAFGLLGKLYAQLLLKARVRSRLSALPILRMRGGATAANVDTQLPPVARKRKSSKKKIKSSHDVKGDDSDACDVNKNEKNVEAETPATISNSTSLNSSPEIDAVAPVPAVRPNSLYRFLLGQGQIGHIILMECVMGATWLQMYLPMLQTMLNTARNIAVGERPNQLDDPSDDAPQSTGFLSSDGNAVRGGRKRKSQIRKADQDAIEQLKHVGDVTLFKYHYTSDSFMKRHHIGPYSTSEASETIQENMINDMPTTQIGKGDHAVDEDSDSDWVVEALSSPTATVLSADDHNDDTNMDASLQLSVDSGRPSVSVGVSFTLGDSTKKRKRKSIATTGPRKSDRQSGVMGRIRASGANSLVGRSLLGAYPGDALPPYQAGNAKGLYALAQRYGYGEWSEEVDTETDDNDDDIFNVNDYGDDSDPGGYNFGEVPDHNSDEGDAFTDFSPPSLSSGSSRAGSRSSSRRRKKRSNPPVSTGSSVGGKASSSNATNGGRSKSRLVEKAMKTVTETVSSKKLKDDLGESEKVVTDEERQTPQQSKLVESAAASVMARTKTRSKRRSTVKKDESTGSGSSSTRSSLARNAASELLAARSNRADSSGGSKEIKSPLQTLRNHAADKDDGDA